MWSFVIAIVLFHSVSVEYEAADSTHVPAPPAGAVAENGAGYPVPALPFDPHTYVVYRTDQPLNIDGRIDEEIWEEAEWTEKFVDIEGELKPLPRFDTRVKMLWDEEYFYFAAELEEPHVWATMTERNSPVMHENNFEIFIDPNGSTHNYWELQINALETVWDHFLLSPRMRHRSRNLKNWNMLDYRAGVQIDGKLNDPRGEDTGWTVEVAMPWEALLEMADGMPGSGDQWRVNFSRVQWKRDVVDGEYRKQVDPETGETYREDNWVWSPQGLVNMHYPEMWGFVQFSEAVAGQAEEPFVWNREEEIKWALRQVFYRQRDYFEKHGRYTEDGAELGVNEITVEGLDFDPEIRTTRTMFEAVSESFDGNRTWHIRHDGRIWSQ
ncbi:MAG: carbohydrate-binding family 9-like protein [Bacteroidota bacterium]